MERGVRAYHVPARRGPAEVVSASFYLAIFPWACVELNRRCGSPDPRGSVTDCGRISRRDYTFAQWSQLADELAYGITAQGAVVAGEIVAYGRTRLCRGAAGEVLY